MCYQLKWANTEMCDGHTDEWMNELIDRWTNKREVTPMSQPAYASDTEMETDCAFGL